MARDRRRRFPVSDTRGRRFDRLEARTLLAVFNVNTTLDLNDSNYDGHTLSLREAILQANATPGADTINVPAGTYKLTIAGAAETGGQSGDLNIFDGVTIAGAGAATTIIDANGLDRAFLILGNGPSNTAVRISGVTIQGGHAPDNAQDGDGGGIGVVNASLTLDQSVVQNNRAGNNLAGGRGGGIDVASGSLTVTGSTISGNTSGSGTNTGGHGGGIASRLSNVTIANSTISNNATGIGSTTNSGPTAGYGGGIEFESNSGAATLAISGTTISGNTSGTAASTGAGGGIFDAGNVTLTIDGSTISGNVGTIDGGGILNTQGTIARIANSTIANNTAQGQKGGHLGGGGIYSDGTITLISGTTISGNQSINQPAGFTNAPTGGGGILNLGAIGTIVNSTIAGNSANSSGGGIVTVGTIAHINGVTISGNTATDGGGIYEYVNATTSGIGDLVNTIAAGNVASGTYPKDLDINAALNSAFNNLVQDPFGHRLVNGSNGNIVGVDAKLGALANNGGPTQTMALLVGSPAIDKGLNAAASSTDQRGSARPYNGIADIGAYEYQPSTNRPPVANNQSITANMNTAFNGTLVATDADNDALTYVAVAQPLHGTLSVQANGAFVYTPTANYKGPDSFTFKAFDGQAYSNVATVAITVVNPNNRPPVANNQTITANWNVANNGVVTATDADNDPITFQALGQPSHGTVSVQANGSFVYTPTTNYRGADSFTFVASDGQASSNIATVSITVINPSNRPPVASNQSATVPQNAPYSGQAIATDADNDPLTLSVVAQPSHGSLNFGLNGAFVYLPAYNYAGPDSFTFKANDGQADGNTATVTITVPAHVNAAPVAAADSYTVNENASITTLPAIATPGALLRFGFDDAGSATTPAVDTGSGTAANGTFTGAATRVNSTPGNGSASSLDLTGGTASLSAPHPAKLDGLTTLTVTGWINLRYAPQDNAPLFSQIAPYNAAAGQGGWELRLAQPQPATSPISGANFGLSFQAAQITAGGGAIAQGTTSTPIDAFDKWVFVAVTYDASRQVSIYAGTPTAPASIKIQTAFSVPLAPNSAPFLIGASNLSPVQNYTPPAWIDDVRVYGSALSSSQVDAVRKEGLGQGVLANDTDPESDRLTANLGASPIHGTVSVNANGTFTYTPYANYAGPDSFTYYPRDAAGLLGNVATVSINVAKVDQPPVANGDTFTITNDAPSPAPVALTSAVLVSNGDPIGGGKSYNFNPGNSAITSFVRGGGSGTAVEFDITAPGESWSMTFEAANHARLTPGTYTGAVGWPSQPAGSPGLFVRHNSSAFNTAYGQFTVTQAAYDGSGNLVSFAARFIYQGDGLPGFLAGQVNFNATAPNVLNNDTDPEFDALTASIVANPSHGSVTLNADGSFNYVPTAGYFGPDSFTYKASDGTLASNVATVNLNVRHVDRPPVAADDAYTLNRNTTATVAAASGVLANDSDPDNDPITALLVAQPSHGSLTFNADGSFAYTPTANYTGQDTFTYKLYDGLVLGNLATVTLTVLDPTPVAANDAYTTAENAPLSVPAAGVLANDNDPNHLTLTAAVVANPAHGSLTLNADGSFAYTPAVNYYGPDSFTYKASNGSLSSNVATVSLTVTHVNQPPVAVNDSYTTSENAALTINAPGVLGNDTDPDNDTLTAIVASQPSHGTLTPNANGSFNYAPAANYYGADSFTYRASDGTLTSNVATVTINVTHVNQPPVAVNDSYATNENAALTINAPGLLGNDTDPDNDTLTAIVVAQPSHGSLTLQANGSFVYTPATNYFGTDSFTYKASDGQLTSNVATVTITVAHVNQPPVAVDDSYSTNENAAQVVNAASGVLANDSDPDNDPMTATVVGAAAHGQVAVNADGSFTYTPAANYFGPDSFTYKASDGSLFSNVATVSLNVVHVNQPPVAANDGYATNENTPISVNAPGLLANDSDPDNDPITSSVVAQPSHGTVTLAVDGSFTYTPVRNYFGPDSFTYRDSDGRLNSNVATVSLVVAQVIRPPSASDQSVVAVQNQAKPITLAATDPDGLAMSYVIVAQPSHGTLSGTAPNLTYTPAANYSGADGFTFQATDAYTSSNVATVSITVKSPIAATIVPPRPQPGRAFSGVVATFTDAYPIAADQYNATITWGDGHVTPGVVAQAGASGFVVIGSNTYAAGGNPILKVVIADPIGRTATVSASLSIRAVAGDFDGDGKADIAVYRPQDGHWYINNSSGGQANIAFGYPLHDLPVPGDYDGDGKVDEAVYRPEIAQWFLDRSSLGPIAINSYGYPGHDTPVPAVYDGTGKTLIALYRPETAQWFILNDPGGPGRPLVQTVIPFGWANHDKPVPADYLGLGFDQIAVYRPGTGDWFIRNPDGSVAPPISLGYAAGDVPVPGDYDGIGHAEVAIYRPATGQYIIFNQDAKTVRAVNFAAQPGDVPVAQDYNGDGKVDPALFRPSNAGWTYVNSTTGMTVSTPYGWASHDFATPGPIAYRATAIQSGYGIPASASSAGGGPGSGSGSTSSATTNHVAVVSPASATAPARSARAARRPIATSHASRSLFDLALESIGRHRRGRFFG